MNFTKREIFGIFLLLVVGLCSFVAWRAFSLVMTDGGVSSIWTPIIWFAFLASIFFLGMIVWKRTFLQFTGGAFVFVSGLFFLRSQEYIIVGAISMMCLYWGSTSVAEECEERTHFHFFKNVKAGSFLFVLGLSLLLSGGYYTFLKDVSWEEMVPRFRIGEEMTGVIFKVAGVTNPSFAKLSDGGMTVDEFLQNLEQNKQDSPLSSQVNNQQDLLTAYPQMKQFLNGEVLPLSLGSKSPKTAEELFLDGGRAQIASLVGRPVMGSEKMSDVLSSAVQNKLIAFLRGENTTQHIPSQAIPFFLALLLFLTLLSFSSLLVPICILVAQAIFWLARKFGWIAMKTLTVEQETLID